MWHHWKHSKWKGLKLSTCPHLILWDDWQTFVLLHSWTRNFRLNSTVCLGARKRRPLPWVSTQSLSVAQQDLCTKVWLKGRTLMDAGSRPSTPTHSLTHSVTWSSISTRLLPAMPPLWVTGGDCKHTHTHTVFSYPGVTFLLTLLSPSLPSALLCTLICRFWKKNKPHKETNTGKVVRCWQLYWTACSHQVEQDEKSLKILQKKQQYTVLAAAGFSWDCDQKLFVSDQKVCFQLAVGPEEDIVLRLGHTPRPLAVLSLENSIWASCSVAGRFCHIFSQGMWDLSAGWIRARPLSARTASGTEPAVITKDVH